MMQSHVADNVRAELARQGKRQVDIAEQLGFTRQALSKRLHGHVDFRVAELHAIAELLGIPISKLVNDSTKAAS